jgi:AcrR family transcriptional regulator
MPKTSRDTTPSKSRGSIQARTKKKSLLAALRPVFENQGFDGATLSQLAEAAGLGKASLYHHFPGGKAEMAAVLLRESVAQLERQAFSKLGSTRPPTARLVDFIEGFSDYVEDGEGRCLVLTLSQGSSSGVHADTIARQYADWLSRLAATYADAGCGAKKSKRLANELLAGLYGHLQTAQLLGSPQVFSKHVKRLKKSQPGLGGR